ncbi:MAG TPA: hypothetical protein VIH99_10635 [Bdellovibrionota bacterium]|jgi:hypothetical protein
MPDRQSPPPHRPLWQRIGAALLLFLFLYSGWKLFQMAGDPAAIEKALNKP